MSAANELSLNSLKLRVVKYFPCSKVFPILASKKQAVLKTLEGTVKSSVPDFRFRTFFLP